MADYQVGVSSATVAVAAARHSAGRAGTSIQEREGRVRQSAQCSVVQCGAWQGGTTQLGSAQLGSAWLGSVRLSSAGLGSARLSPARLHSGLGARLFDGSTWLGLSSALPALLSSAQLPHRGPWMADDSPRSRARAWVWALRHQPRAGSPSRARDSCTPTGRPSSDSCTPTGRPSSLAADGDPSRRLGTARPHCSGRPSCQRRLPSVREAHSGG